MHATATAPMHVARTVPHPAIISSVQLGFTPHKQCASSDVQSCEHDGRSPPRALLRHQWLNDSHVACKRAFDPQVWPTSLCSAKASLVPTAAALCHPKSLLHADAGAVKPANILPGRRMLLHLAAGRQRVATGLATNTCPAMACHHTAHAAHGAAGAHMACCPGRTASGAGRTTAQ